MARTCDRCGDRAEFVVEGFHVRVEGSKKPPVDASFDTGGEFPPDVCLKCLVAFIDVGKGYFRPAMITDSQPCT